MFDRLCWDIAQKHVYHPCMHVQHPVSLQLSLNRQHTFTSWFRVVGCPAVSRDAGTCSVAVQIVSALTVVCHIWPALIVGESVVWVSQVACAWDGGNKIRVGAHNSKEGYSFYANSMDYGFLCPLASTCLNDSA